MLTTLTDKETESKSCIVYKKSKEVIPGGVNSPVRSFPGLELDPLIVESGKEDLITDVDGRFFIDYCGSWGALIHGHAHPRIVDAVQKRVALGSTFGIATHVEEKIARKITELVPSIEMLRFVSSGTEATMSAIRLARGFTGRELIVKFAGHYHGHADAFLVQAGSGLVNLSPTSSSAGVPDACVKHTLCLPFNDFAALRSTFKEQGTRIAAVIVEPIAGNIGVVPPEKGFLELLRELTTKTGSLLIFDEVITGFRVGLHGAQGLFKIQPDLTCLGKVIGGGFPAAAFGGRKDIMKMLAPLGPVYQAGTLSGNPVAMEAGLQALNLLDTPGFYEKLEEKTQNLTAPIKNAIVKRQLNACIQEQGSMFTLFFGAKKVTNLEDAKKLDAKLFQHFFRFLFQRGVYVAPSQHEANFVSSAHSDEHLAHTRDLILEFLNSL